ncbi:MAG: hypothetical protein ACK4WF_06115 [Candidatus Brocadiales bacterium]
MKIVCDKCGDLPLPPMVREDKVIRLDSERSPLALRCKRCQAGLYMDMRGDALPEKWWTEDDLHKYITACMRGKEYVNGRGGGVSLQKLLTEIFERHVVE